jgi:hypothetical protein
LNLGVRRLRARSPRSSVFVPEGRCVEVQVGRGGRRWWRSRRACWVKQAVTITGGLGGGLGFGAVGRGGMRTWALRRACYSVRLGSPTKVGVDEVRSIRSNDGADSTHDRC